MEKRLKKLLLFYCVLFLALSFAGAILLQFLGSHTFLQDFLLALRAVSLSCGSFQSIISASDKTGYILLALIECGAILWLFFSLQFANIIGQSNIFHNAGNSEHSVLPAKTIFRKALIYIFLLEAFSALTLFAFSKNLSADEPVFWSVVNGISIVSHAGFSFNLYSAAFREAYIFQFVIAGLLIVSRLGYPVYFDLANINRLRERMLHPEKNWTLQTRVSFYTTAVLLLVGCIIYWFDRSEILSQLKIVAAAISVFFNVTGWQGAGFATALPGGFLLNLLALILMLAGLSPGSFGLLNYGLYANLFSKSKAKKAALAILIYCVSVILIGAILIFSTQQLGFSEALFNCVSIFTNTGLLHEPFLSAPIYVFLLIAGRIGIPVVLVFAYLKFCRNEEPSELMLI